MLASVLQHPVETLVAAVRERDGRPVWTGSLAAPMVWPLLVGATLIGSVGVIQVGRHVGSPELVLGLWIGLVLAVGGTAALLLATRRARRRAAQTLAERRPGAPTWRCTTGPGFPDAMASFGTKVHLSPLRAELTLVEAPAGLELWSDGATEPSLHLPWSHMASVDAQRAPNADLGILVARMVDGRRLPVVLMRERAGSQRGADLSATEQYAAHLARTHLARR